ncbi:MAG TPA: response regulator [Polyangiaceae bacterium]|nr:response regulator [Polyangiaceae bacterium]
MKHQQSQSAEPPRGGRLKKLCFLRGRRRAPPPPGQGPRRLGLKNTSLLGPPRACVREKYASSQFRHRPAAGWGYHGEVVVKAARRILVIEDVMELQRLFRRRAEREGLEVIAAFTCAEGLALASSVAPDLILVDLHLPDGDGLDLVRRLRADDRIAHAPVAVWSGSDATGSELDALRAGASAYFEKTDLKKMMKRILELLSAG